MITPYDDAYFMKQALNEAQRAFDADEVPVGAVIVANQQIIARAHNFTEKLNDVTAHAEMQAITSAADFLGGKYLTGCTMYVTLEPCVMCAGALYWSQLDRVVFAASDEKRGSSRHGNLYHPKTVVLGGILEEEGPRFVAPVFSKNTIANRFIYFRVFLERIDYFRLKKM